MSLVGLGDTNLPAVNVLRLFRVFKILRLFRRLTSLRILVSALSSSIIPVLNAMVILLLVTTMYSVVATDLFRNKSVYFETFAASTFTLFQIATGDAWSSTVARELLREFDGNEQPLVATFFVSYYIVVGLVLMNIVVAVLLDEFISTVAREKAEDRAKAEEADGDAPKRTEIPTGPLDPLVRGLLAYTNQDDLMRRIQNLYQRLDLDENGAISLEELNVGLRKIHGASNFRLSADDFNLVTDNARLLNQEGELTPAAFEVMMMNQIKGFSQRKVLCALTRNFIRNDENAEDTMFALKCIMTTLDTVEAYYVNTDAFSHHKPYIKSRKEVLNRLFKSSLYCAFRQWKMLLEHEGEAQSPDTEAGSVPRSRSFRIGRTAQELAFLVQAQGGNLQIGPGEMLGARYRGDEGSEGGTEAADGVVVRGGEEASDTIQVLFGGGAREQTVETAETVGAVTVQGMEHEKADDDKVGGGGGAGAGGGEVWRSAVSRDLRDIKSAIQGLRAHMHQSGETLSPRPKS